MKKKEEPKKDLFYNLTPIMDMKKKMAPIYGSYFMIYGERSKGKTYALLKYSIEEYIKTGEVKQFVYLRRWEEEIKGFRGSEIFNGLLNNYYGKNDILEITNGRYNNITYERRKYFLTYTNEDNEILRKSASPVGYAMALTNVMKDKGQQLPHVSTIIFDEFLTRGGELPDEFNQFCNAISTIIRLRDDVNIFMLGNTVNRYSTYFSEMRITNAKNIKPGDIDVYAYKNERLKVFVEYTEPAEEGKASDFYFAFDSPELAMITDGSWQIPSYPKCPMKYRPKDVVYTYYIVMGEDELQADIVNIEGIMFTYVHQKTYEIDVEKYQDRIIFSLLQKPGWRYRKRIDRPLDNIGKIIWGQFQSEQVYFQNNEIGDAVWNYIQMK